MSRSLPSVAAAAVSLFVCLFLLPACEQARAAGPPSDEGHSHGPGDDAHSHAADELEPVVITRFGERLLLFLEFPPLIAGEPARFLAHYSVLATGEPVRAGDVALHIGDTTSRVAAPTRDGLFIPEGAYPEAGRFAARLDLRSDQGSESFDLGEVVVHASADAVHLAAEADAHDEPADVVPFLLEQQWKLALLLAEAGPRELTRRLVVPARLVPAEGATAMVAAPAGGRLLTAAEGVGLPRSGELVRAGQLLARIEPPLSTGDVAQLASLRMEWDLQVLEVERGLAEAETRLRYAEIELERVAGLVDSGLGTQQERDAAERDRALARAALDGALGARRALSNLEGRASPERGVSFDLRAPLDGVVVSAGRVLGESVEAGETVLRLVDPSRLWVAGRVSEFDLAGLPAQPEATVSLPGLPGVRLALGGDSGNDWLPPAPEIDGSTRTLLVRYALDDASTTMRAGMLAELELALERQDADVVVPFEAIVMEQGLPTAYVMLDGETFQRRDLRLGLRDGDHVEVLDGIAPGEHVATRGAHVVRLAALSPESFGHGHAH